VKRDVAPAVAGGPGGDRDQGGADGGGARFRQGAGSEGAGGADQVEGMAAMTSQAAFALK
jgi:hypothetical protein